MKKTATIKERAEVYVSSQEIKDEEILNFSDVTNAYIAGATEERALMDGEKAHVKPLEEIIKEHGIHEYDVRLNAVVHEYAA